MTREEAIKILKAIRVYDCYPKSAGEETKEAIDMAIEALSTANLKEEFESAVVRCKDCVWGKEWNDKQIFCERILMRLRETDFCSYGERESNDIRKSNNADKNSNR